jgi:hypothetical protein
MASFLQLKLGGIILLQLKTWKASWPARSISGRRILIMPDEDSIDSTIKAWQPFYGRELTRLDGEEIISNWNAYINLISEWLSALHSKPK